MARLTDIRSTIIQASDPALAAVTTEEVDVEEWSFDDDDFWEAIDLMETSYKLIMAMLKSCRGLTLRQQRLLERHADDLKMFTDEFPLVLAGSDGTVSDDTAGGEL